MPHPFRFRLTLIAALLTVVTLSHPFTLSNQLAAAGPLSQADEIAQRLQERHTGLVDGQSLRIAIGIVTQDHTHPDRHINTWIDRKVNPDTPVFPGSLGPTRYASLCKIAKSAGCVCYPVDNCILIGRPSWVAELSRTIFFDSDRSLNGQRRVEPRNASIDVQWPELTTPTEALRIVDGQFAQRPTDPAFGSPVPNALPHDLWPAIMLRDISPHLVQHLIRGQFCDGTESKRVSNPFGRSYRFTGLRDSLDSIRQIDPNLKAKTSGGLVRLLGSPAAHQLLCQKLLSVVDAKAVQRPVNPAGGNAMERLQANERTFTLTVNDQPAGKLIKALTAQIGIECEFDAAANPQLANLVAISAVDQTVWQLVRLITDQASLKIQAAGDKLRISAKK